MIFWFESGPSRSRLLLEGYLPEQDAPAENSRSRSPRFGLGRRRTAGAFERDYPAMLLALASSIRTGLDPLAALFDLSEIFAANSEISAEIRRVKDAIDSGAGEEEAVRRFGASIDQPDIPLFTSAFILARREGSSLAECLQRLARVTRQRQSFRRKVRSAVAMQKLSCIGIGLSAVAVGFVQVASNPKALGAALSDPIGARLLGAGAVLILGGILWMFKVSAPRV